MIPVLLLGPDGGPLARDGLETGLDGLHRARRVTRHTLGKNKLFGFLLHDFS